MVYNFVQFQSFTHWISDAKAIMAKRYHDLVTQSLLVSNAKCR